MVREILKQGNPKLYEVCGEVTNEEREIVKAGCLINYNRKRAGKE